MQTLRLKTDTGDEVYIELSEESNTILIPPERRPGGEIAGGPGERAARMINNLQEVGDAIAGVCRMLHGRINSALNTSRPRELTLEFGIKLTGEAGIPLVTKGSAEGTFNVTATWSFSEPLTK